MTAHYQQVPTAQESTKGKRQLVGSSLEKFRF